MLDFAYISGGTLIGTVSACILILWVKVVVIKAHAEAAEISSNYSFKDNSINITEWLIIAALAITAGAFAWWRQWNPEFFSDIILVMALAGVALIDRKTMLIEGRLVALAIVLRICWLLYFTPQDLQNYVTGLLIGAGLLFFVGFLYETFRDRQGLGDGDAAVLGLIGLWVGWQGLGAVLLIATVTGIIIGGITLIKKREKNQKFQTILQTKIPFAPYLCFAGLTVYLIQETRSQYFILMLKNF